MTANSFLGIHFGIWATISAVIAVVYYFVWPRPVNNINSRPLWRHIIIRWFHSLTWLFITISFVVRLAFGADGETAGDILVILGFIFYLVFIVVSNIDRRAPD